MDKQNVQTSQGIPDQQLKKRQAQGPLAYEPIKMERVSLLSTESHISNYRGFINLGFLILLVNHLRLIVENFLKYGVLLKNIPFIDSIKHYNESPIILALFHVGFNCFIAFVLQIIQYRGFLSQKLILFLNIINISSLFLLPVKLIQSSHPAINLVFLTTVCIIVMKLISYAHVMRHVLKICRRIQQSKNTPIDDLFEEYEVSKQNQKIIQKHVNNQVSLVDMKHFIYFLFTPTYCFQLTYPRTQHIRKLWLFKRFVELICVLSLQLVLWYQYVEPLLHNTYRQYEQDNYEMKLLSLLERLLKLAIPNTYFWISFFYGFFQVWLNILSELLRFADRQFYLDWWNCRNLEEYWRQWNLPVHQWMIRHVYFPLLNFKINKNVANLLVFLISAIGHEFVVSASLGILEYWAFLGMLLQAPVILIQKKIERILNLRQSQLGNAMFWISFCFLGQPLMIFIYYYQFLKQYRAKL